MRAPHPHHRNKRERTKERGEEEGGRKEGVNFHHNKNVYYNIIFYLLIILILFIIIIFVVRNIFEVHCDKPVFFKIVRLVTNTVRHSILSSLFFLICAFKVHGLK